MELGLKCHIQTWGNGEYGEYLSPNTVCAGVFSACPDIRKEKRRVSGNTSFICFSSRPGDVLGLKGNTWLWLTVAGFVVHFSWLLGVEKVLLSVLAGGCLCSSVGTFLNRQNQGRWFYVNS